MDGWMGILPTGGLLCLTVLLSDSVVKNGFSNISSDLNQLPKMELIPNHQEKIEWRSEKEKNTL